MSGNGTDYSEWYFTLSSEEQKKYKSPNELLKAMTEPNPSLNLPTAADHLNKRFEHDLEVYRLGAKVYDELLKLAEEAERHKLDYDARREGARASEGTAEYWKGRRDEAGHFRDRIIALLESLGK